MITFGVFTKYPKGYFGGLQSEQKEKSLSFYDTVSMDTNFNNRFSL